MSETTYIYPFDPTGLRVSNHIEGEVQVLSPPAWRDYHFVIPLLAPFFHEGFHLRHLDTNRDLVEGVDFLFTHRFYSASQAIMKPIYGSVLFLDKTLDGAVEMSYQTLGGEWTIDGALVTQILSQKQVNPRITTWEQVASVPTQFPVIDHQWHLTDMVGMSEVRAELESIADVLEGGTTPNSEFQQHKTNFSNPHQVTKAQLELGLVENLPPATRAQAINGTHDASVMTPRRTFQAFEEYIKSLVARIDTFEASVIQRLDALETAVSQHGFDTPPRILETDDPGVDPATVLSDHLAATDPHEVTASTFSVGDLENETLLVVSTASDLVADTLSQL